jgi:hypothetical protein
MTKKTKSRGDGINLLAGDQEALRNAGAGGLSDYAKQAFAEGGTLTLTPEEAANSGAGFVQDLLKADLGTVDPVPPEPAVLTSITPDTAVIGDPDLTLSAIGTGFTAESVIVFNGGDEPTTFVSATEVTTGVKPSTATTAGAYPVFVRGADGAETASLDFTFTDPVTRSSRRGG